METYEERRMLNAAICDDERMFSENLEVLLKKTHKTRKIDIYSGAEGLILDIEAGANYDIIFMDIDFEGNETGIDYAEKLYGLCPTTNIVYVTGYNDRYSQMVLLGQANVSGYLVKPVQEELLLRYLEKIEKEKIKEETEILVINMLGNLYKVPRRDIYYMESQGHTVYIYTEFKKYRVYKKLGDFKIKLGENFVQCHKSFLVNMDKICRFESQKVVLNNEVEIPISKGRNKKARDAYFEYMGGRV